MWLFKPFFIFFESKGSPGTKQQLLEVRTSLNLWGGRQGLEQTEFHYFFPLRGCWGDHRASAEPQLCGLIRLALEAVTSNYGRSRIKNEKPISFPSFFRRAKRRTKEAQLTVKIKWCLNFPCFNKTAPFSTNFRVRRHYLKKRPLKSDLESVHLLIISISFWTVCLYYCSFAKGFKSKVNSSNLCTQSVLLSPNSDLLHLACERTNYSVHFDLGYLSKVILRYKVK